MRETPPPAANAPQSHFRWPLAIALALGCGTVLIPSAAVSRGDAPRPAPKPERPVQALLGAPRLGEPLSIALRTDAEDEKDKEERKKIAAPDLDGGIAWLNTGGPLSLKK